ncbi:MAG: type II toxin-antitoxin system RelE family toxin [Gammaproteobacteria bacterium]
MGSYGLSFKRPVTKDFRSIPPDEVRRILPCIESLALEPRPPGGQRLVGQERYRVRVGRYRVVYEIQDDVLRVIVVAVGHRQGIYR